MSAPLPAKGNSLRRGGEETQKTLSHLFISIGNRMCDPRRGWQNSVRDAALVSLHVANAKCQIGIDADLFVCCFFFLGCRRGKKLIRGWIKIQKREDSTRHIKACVQLASPIRQSLCQVASLLNQTGRFVESGRRLVTEGSTPPARGMNGMRPKAILIVKDPLFLSWSHSIHPKSVHA
jgi:hypothetical protein